MPPATKGAKPLPLSSSIVDFKKKKVQNSLFQLSVKCLFSKLSRNPLWLIPLTPMTPIASFPQRATTGCYPHSVPRARQAALLTFSEGNFRRSKLSMLFLWTLLGLAPAKQHTFASGGVRAGQPLRSHCCKVRQMGCCSCTLSLRFRCVFSPLF